MKRTTILSWVGQARRDLRRDLNIGKYLFLMGGTFPSSWGGRICKGERDHHAFREALQGLYVIGFLFLLCLNLLQVIAVWVCYPGDRIFEMTPNTRMGA